MSRMKSAETLKSKSQKARAACLPYIDLCLQIVMHTSRKPIREAINILIVVSHQSPASSMPPCAATIPGTASVELNHQTFTSRTAVPCSASQLVRTRQQQLHLRILLIVHTTLLVTPEFPDPCEQPCPVAVASEDDVIRLFSGDVGSPVKSVVVHFDERVTRFWPISAFVVLAGLTSDATLMD